jgi:hypothetical protein
MGVALTTQLNDPRAVPYFLWDEPMTVAEVRERLADAPASEQARILGKILREARDDHAWLFTTPRDVAARWKEIIPHLGRRRAFWEYLFSRWREDGLLAP